MVIKVLADRHSQSKWPTPDLGFGVVHDMRTKHDAGEPVAKWEGHAFVGPRNKIGSLVDLESVVQSIRIRSVEEEEKGR